VNTTLGQFVVFYSDIFVTILSCAIKARFQQISKRISRNKVCSRGCSAETEARALRHFLILICSFVFDLFFKHQISDFPTFKKQSNHLVLFTNP
jgi:hypothetical protein